MAHYWALGYLQLGHRNGGERSQITSGLCPENHGYGSDYEASSALKITLLSLPFILNLLNLLNLAQNLWRDSSEENNFVEISLVL